ncbi:MAG TPA: hypothetical protein VJ809_08330, partial [Pirellulales bacterium]|nr:hypothetical protein [Pirellulales bacterium]
MSRQQSLSGSQLLALRLASGICLATVAVLALSDLATGQERRESAPFDQKALAEQDRVRRGPPRGEEEKAKPAEKSGATVVESPPAMPQESSKPAQQPA